MIFRSLCFPLREMKLQPRFSSQVEDPFSSQLSRQIVIAGIRFKFQRFFTGVQGTERIIDIGERKAFKSKLESKGS